MALEEFSPDAFDLPEGPLGSSIDIGIPGADYISGLDLSSSGDIFSGQTSNMDIPAMLSGFDPATGGISGSDKEFWERYGIKDESGKFIPGYLNTALMEQDFRATHPHASAGSFGDFLKIVIPIGLNFIAPGVGGAIGSAVTSAIGVSASAAVNAAIGNIIINTAMNGGNIEQAVKSTAGQWIGSEVGSFVGSAAGKLFDNATIGKFVGDITSAGTRALINGQDAEQAMLGSLAGNVIGFATSKIPGYDSLPSSIKNSISTSIALSLQGKNVDIGQMMVNAAQDAVLAYGLSQIDAYKSAPPMAQSFMTTMLRSAIKGSDLSQSAINWTIGNSNALFQRALSDSKDPGRLVGSNESPEYKQLVATLAGGDINKAPADADQFLNLVSQEIKDPSQQAKQLGEDFYASLVDAFNDAKASNPGISDANAIKLAANDVKIIYPGWTEALKHTVAGGTGTGIARLLFDSKIYITPPTGEVTAPAASIITEEKYQEIQKQKLEAQKEEDKALSDLLLKFLIPKLDPLAPPDIVLDKDLDKILENIKKLEGATETGAPADQTASQSEQAKAAEEAAAKAAEEEARQKAIKEAADRAAADEAARAEEAARQAAADKAAKEAAEREAQEAAERAAALAKAEEDARRQAEEAAARAAEIEAARIAAEKEAQRQRDLAEQARLAREAEERAKAEAAAKAAAEEAARKAAEEAAAKAAAEEAARKAKEAADAKAAADAAAKEAADKAAADKALAEKAALEKAAAEKAAADQAAADKAAKEAADKAAADKAAADKAAADKAAADKAAAEEASMKRDREQEETLAKVADEASKETGASTDQTAGTTGAVSTTQTSGSSGTTTSDTSQTVSTTGTTGTTGTTETSGTSGTTQTTGTTGTTETTGTTGTTQTTGTADTTGVTGVTGTTEGGGETGGGTGESVGSGSGTGRSTGTGEGTGFGTADGTGTGLGTGEGTGTGTGTGEGTGTGTGSGTGAGGEGSGTGTGTGSGSGSGSGGGSGSGSGTGTTKQITTTEVFGQSRRKPPEQPQKMPDAALRSLDPYYLARGEAKFVSPLQQYLKMAGVQEPQPLRPPTAQQNMEPDMATQEDYFSYGKSQDIQNLLDLASGVTQFASGGEVEKMAPPLMAAGGKLRQDFRHGSAVSGPGDGQSDDIPAMLADGEFVFPADVVAALGNGSTKAGSDKLYKMMHEIRAYHRSASPKDLPPPAKKSPLDYLKSHKGRR